MSRSALFVIALLGIACFGGSGSEAFLPTSPEPGDGSGPPPPAPTPAVVTKVRLVSPSILAVGEQAQLGIVALDADGKPITSTAPVHYYSTNPSVATTTVEGLLVAHATGTTTVWGVIDYVRPDYRTVTVR